MCAGPIPLRAHQIQTVPIGQAPIDDQAVVAIHRDLEIGLGVAPAQIDREPGGPQSGGDLVAEGEIVLAHQYPHLSHYITERIQGGSGGHDLRRRAQGGILGTKGCGGTASINLCAPNSALVPAGTARIRCATAPAPGSPVHPYPHRVSRCVGKS